MPAGRSVTQVIPGLGVLRTYRAGWLGKDLVAGLILTALLVPQGMAYAELAGLPPITGLTRRSSAWSGTRSSARRESWSSARTRHSAR